MKNETFILGIADLVITEDLNIILFGCSKVCFQMNFWTGYGVLLDSEKICTAIQLQPDKYTFDKFKHMCILSGCTYMEPLEGINLQNAHEFITVIQETNPEIVSIITIYLISV